MVRATPPSSKPGLRFSFEPCSSEDSEEVPLRTTTTVIIRQTTEEHQLGSISSKEHERPRKGRHLMSVIDILPNFRQQ
ncbi:hypothetical protein KIN20_025529 [Parelaphostrongylus tenuis]|uniref:Uncharacterized protein n=1 Tax=Parelaphostrongylus tenuis TaxID=148309 RepID=A0AAD5QWP4_PARTN|nr:hypothetical protein KIN20_025529 [Parelaphostrongylus tenuis]